jgi:Flp pilus assembly pilin Flp
MKQLASNYSISGSSVTLTGVNVPLSQILLVSDATTGSVLYSMAGPSALSYTQATNSVITLATAPGASDKLTIYYDDGVASTNAPSSVSVSNFPASTEISNDVGNPIPVSGTVAVSNPVSTVSISNFPSSTSVTNGGTFAVQNTAAIIGGNSVAVKVDNSAVTQPISGTVTVSNPQTSVSISGTPTVAISGTVPVSGSFYPSTQPISAASLPLPNGAAQDGTDGTGITCPTGGSGIRGWLSGIYSKIASTLSASITNFPATFAATQSGAWSTGRTWNLASGSDSITATISGTPAVSISGTPTVNANITFPSTQNVALVSSSDSTAIPVSGSVSISGTPSVSAAISNFPSTQAVSGTVAVSNQPSSISINNSTGSPVPVTLVGDSVSAVPVSGTVAISNPQTSVSITGTPTVSVSGTVPVSASALPLPSGAAQDGIDGTGITAPTGGSGIRGWLSGIYSKLSSALAVTQSGTWATGRTWNLASGSDSVTATISGTVPVSGIFYQATQPVSGSVSITGTPTVSGTVTANAGTNLNTSALALESGGNLATIANNTSPGTAVTGQSLATGSGLIGWLSNIYKALTGTLTASVSGTVAATQSGSWTTAISGTVPVSGTFWQTTQPVSIATMPSTPVTGTFWQTTQPVSLASLPSLASGSNTIGSVNIVPSTSSSPTTFTATTSTQILTSNSSRKGIVLSSPSVNTGICYVMIGTTTASSTAFSFLLNPGDIISLSGISHALTGIWSASSNNLYVTELT